MLDLECTLIREYLGLPSGTVDLDLAEAFDSVFPPDVVVRAHDGAGITGGKWWIHGRTTGGK